jgi:oxaloacetate decarboxylase alpha subunit
MNIKEIKELVKMLDGTDINELTIESEGNRVVIKKGAGSLPHISPPINQIVPYPIMNAPNIAVSNAPPVAPVTEDKSEGLGPNQVLIVAPMVGTFYRCPSPDADPYVQVGQMIEVGQVVCIIEAMKLMNEIESEWRGRIVEVLVENAHPIEYGQPLFVLEKV